jgi:hypothetical protein
MKTASGRISPVFKIGEWREIPGGFACPIYRDDELIEEVAISDKADARYGAVKVTNRAWELVKRGKP